MTPPFLGNLVPLAKLPALSLTKSSESSLWMRPETTRSPEAVMNPVRIRTPAGTTAGPTVGANCRRGESTDAMGWLKLGPICTRESEEGRMEIEFTLIHTNTGDIPRFRALVRR
jgi:hypothetical protein